MATTPPPPSPSSLRVPAAPLHGAGYDQYGPYPTRSSARLASRRAARSIERTPEPVCPSSPSKMQSRGSPRKHPRVDREIGSSWKSMGKDAFRQSGSIMISDATISDATDESSGVSGYPHRHASSLSHPHLAGTQGLPTPVKTPTKRSIQGDLSSTSRTLFPPTGKMSAKKSSPFSLESFETSSTTDIQIFTDSRDRIPVPSSASDNPFASHADAAETSSPAKKGKRAATRIQQTEDSPRTPVTAPRCRLDYPSEEEPLPTPDGEGMTMIFRGKKIFTPFNDLDEQDDDGEDLGLFASRPDLLGANPDILKSAKPLTRRSIKPRVLFPEAAKGSHRGEEEVPTDEEDAQEADAQPPAIPDNTPAFTPELPQQPQTPGATRLLRSNARFVTQEEETPTGTNTTDTKRKRIGAFDHWLRKKQAIEEMSSPASPAKREADPSNSSVARPSAKKTRSARAGASTAPSI